MNSLRGMLAGSNGLNCEQQCDSQRVPEPIYCILYKKVGQPLNCIVSVPTNSFFPLKTLIKSSPIRFLPSLKVYRFGYYD